ncbi:MAG TPA: penicillin-binding protein 2 [Rhizomicrobium sp.]
MPGIDRRLGSPGSGQADGPVGGVARAYAGTPGRNPGSATKGVTSSGQETDIVERRIVIAAALSVMAFALIGVRLVDVGVFKGHMTGAAPAAAEHPMGARADLVDRNNLLLARNLPVADLYAQPHTFSDKNAAAQALAGAAGVSAQRLQQEFQSKHNYVLVAQQLVPDAQQRVNRLGLPGLEFEPAAKRYYPEGSGAMQVLGFTDPAGHGIAGLELGLDSTLANAEPGASVALSLDMRVQYALAHEVEQAREEFTARAAGGIVLDVRSGEVLAMASLPDSPGEKDADPTIDPRRNCMAQDRYELGSVFKIFSFALAMQDHTIRLDQPFAIGRGFKIGRYTIHDAEHMPATLAARDVLAQSSNAGTAQIALLSGPERQRAFLGQAGLLSPLHTELPEASRPPHFPSHWGEIETATIGFGHGISVTPLSFAAAAAAIVNGGRRITPTFLKHDGDARGEQVISPETSATMRELLRYVVTNGTGKKADVPGYDVGGKTGSAEKVGGRRYVAHRLLTSFCAFFPIANPRYLVFVMLDEPHGTKETFGLALAGFTAAPLAGRVIARIAPMLGVPVTALVPAPVRTKENT